MHTVNKIVGMSTSNESRDVEKHQGSMLGLGIDAFGASPEVIEPASAETQSAAWTASNCAAPLASGL